MSSVSLPPVPDLIPISQFQINNTKSSGRSRQQQQQSPCATDRFEVMGEQRSRRTGKQPQPAIDLIDTARSRGPSAASQAQPPFAKTRPERHRKSERRREHRRARKRSPSKQSGARTNRTPSSSLEDRPVNPRVNPIFVWVRQEDTHIVDVKCEDYDKRNRILLTKTAQGWRAIPRTETLVPTLKDQDDKGKGASQDHQHHQLQEEPRLRKQRKTHKIKRRSTGVQVGEDDDISDPLSDPETRIPSPPASWDDPVNIESHLPSHTIRIPKKDPLDVNKACDVSPLDNLLAVAELELQSNDWDKCTESVEKPKSPEETDIELDKFIDSCTTESNPHYDDSIQKNPEESDYNDEDDNNLAMDDILNRLEQSLRSPENPQADQKENDDDMKKEDEDKTHEEDEIVEIPDDEPDVPTDLSTKKDEDQPTDLSLPKRNKSPPPRPSSHSSETIQSPQPSGIPAVPPSPDILVQNQKSKFLESLLQKTQESEKEPLDLNFRKSASPTVTCSEEVKNSKDAEPPSKKLKVEDITLKRLLDVQAESKSDTSKIKETSRLLELLSCPVEQDPIAQLNQVLSDNTINIPDPLLVPKNRLSQILSSPAREIPRLLIDRPELRLPQALAFPHLLQDPDILVITIQQLQTIIQKQNQLPLKESSNKTEEKTNYVEEKKTEDPLKAPTPKSQENNNHNNTNKEDKAKDKKRMNELASDIDAASNAAFNQMMWLPYFNQMENNPMANSNSDFLKLLAMSYSHPPEMAHLLGMNRFMPPSTFPMQPSPFPNPMEYNWQEMMMMRPKNQYDVFNKNMYKEFVEKTKKFPPSKPSGKSNNYHNTFPHSMPSFPPTPNPLINLPFNGRPNLHVPQFNPNNMGTHQTSRGSHTNTNSTNTNNNRSTRGYTQKSSQSQRIDVNYGLPVSNKGDEKKSCPSSTNRVVQDQHQARHQKFEMMGNVPKHSGMQPIDLSGSTASGGKLKVRQHLIDPGHAARMLKQDDVAEVGSTTASIEEMQDAQKYLWHPLFGNQKNYTSPWNWTTVTATGE